MWVENQAQRCESTTYSLDVSHQLILAKYSKSGAKVPEADWWDLKRYYILYFSRPSKLLLFYQFIKMVSSIQTHRLSQ